ncbi:hypothetical protein MUP77_03930 [Candidatus Bathyarchaeota archaeon]|nr:hypothetical protein [Candidatus Bathyarchaeota archaeon]
MKKTEEEKTEAGGDVDRSEQKEEAEKASLLTATRRVLEKGREELEIINLLMAERPKIRPVRNMFRRRIDEICGSRKAEKRMDQG